MRQNKHKSRFAVAHDSRTISNRPRKRMRAGLTLAELVVAAVIVVVVILALGTAIADGVRGWHKMYDRVYADIVSDSYVARKVFDREIRRATRKMYQVDSAGQWLETYYYSSPVEPVVDMYTRFYAMNGALILQTGKWSPTEGHLPPVKVEIVCQNVVSCVFKADGRSAQMVLTLDDGSQNIVVVSSAVMHNGS